MRPRRIAPTDTGVRNSEGRTRDSGPASLDRSRKWRSLLGVRGLGPRVRPVCHRLAVLLVQQRAVVGGAYLDDVFAGSAGDLVGPRGAIGVVPYDDGLVAGATVYRVVAATAKDGVIAIPADQPIGAATA